HDDVAQRQNGVDGSLGGGVHDASQTTLLELSRRAAEAPEWAARGQKPRALVYRDWPERGPVQGPAGFPLATVVPAVARARPGRQQCPPCAPRAHRAVVPALRSLRD